MSGEELSHVLDVFNTIRTSPDTKTCAIALSDQEPEIVKAFDYAAQALEGKMRRMTGRPYLDHVAQVWFLVRTAGANLNQQIAAIHHDTVEDGQLALGMDARSILSEIGCRHNPVVEKLVRQLTNLSGNRDFGEKEKFATALTGAARPLKAADSTCNLFDVAQNRNPSWSDRETADYVGYRHALLVRLQPVPELVSLLFNHLVGEIGHKYGENCIPETVRRSPPLGMIRGFY